MSGPGSPFFEGTEKKFELVVDPGLASFLERGHAYWTAVARSAGADVLSWISNERCCAYLLSESSLFVFDHRVVMMTCGCSALHDAVLKILEDVPAEKVRTLVYKRKHEIFPHDQPTSFFDDVKILSRELPGRAYQFGNEDEHHLYVFHLDRQRGVGPAGTSVEMLMHGLGDGVGDDFRLSGRRTVSRVRAATGIDFDNMSGDPEQEYFSDGISEDIITDLSKVSALFVVARNTTFTYKNRPQNQQDVARELSVDFLVEGSVRKAGNRVRITAQLIEGATGGHLWAERYDRELTDIFEVQDEITQEIVSALKVVLRPEERARALYSQTRNLDAYDLYSRIPA